MGFPGGAVIKNLPASAGDAVDMALTPGSERPLEKEMATHSSILAWRIPQQRNLAGYSLWGHKSQKRLGTHMHTHTQ